MDERHLYIIEWNNCDLVIYFWCKPNSGLSLNVVYIGFYFDNILQLT